MFTIHVRIELVYESMELYLHSPLCVYNVHKIKATDVKLTH
jgi:hypothetical protein